MTLANKTKPQRTEVCIIGAGASGSAAAKVLTESGVNVVALEKGPWRTPESFGGDELANAHRYNLWPDPIINPRTFRSAEEQDPTVELFCPVPQMVGGGTVHWTGWVPRMPEDDFRQHTLHGDVAGASLADWPIGYEDLEPYYDRVEWSLGVSGDAGANKYEAPRSRDYPVPRCRPPATRTSSTRAAPRSDTTPSRRRRRCSRSHTTAVRPPCRALSCSSTAIPRAPSPPR